MPAINGEKRRYTLQPRDLAILCYLRDHKTLNLELIRERFWPGMTYHSCYYRMKDLAALGVVEWVNNIYLRGAAQFYLTRAGLEILIENGLASRSHRLKVPDATDIVRSDGQHNLRVAAIRIKLVTDPEIMVTHWISDVQIKSDPQTYDLTAGKRPALKGIRHNPRREGKYRLRIPDAIFDLKDAVREAQVILEYEHGYYARDQYQAYVANWEELWGDYQKLIVASSPERVEKLRRWCLEDLKDRYRLDLKEGSGELARRASAYLFIDYHALIKDGLTRRPLKTPTGEMRLTPIESKHTAEKGKTQYSRRLENLQAVI